MKLKPSLLAGALVAAMLVSPAAAQMRALSDPVLPHPDPESLFTSKDKKLNRNKQAALHIQRDLLKCNEWGRAGEWLTDRYIQHNPLAASGLKGVIEYFVNVAKRPRLDPCPALSAEDPNAVVAVTAEGDYVTIMSRRIVPYADDPGKSYTTTWFDTWRFVDGKADEHWDPATLPTGAPPAPPPPAASREADRDAIEALMWRYDRALDTFNADAYAAAFTEDGTFGESKGRAALHKMISDYANREGGPPKTQHASTNHWIEFVGPDRAKIHYYWQTYRLGSGKMEDPPVLLAAGNGVDEVVKVGGKWFYQTRDIAPTQD